MLDIYLQANILGKPVDMLKIGLCHQTNILPKFDEILKVAACHLAGALFISDDKADDITKKRLVASN